MVVVRPDQYIAHVLPLDACRELTQFFAGLLQPADDFLIKDGAS